ncbi:hypothetical protein K3495_g1823 [Podosphaera aphanis]|nr:hypothetical protein K3495_g1823 [Podosphaera aphanis]
MRIRVPESEGDSTSEVESFFSLESENMTGPLNSQTPQGQDAPMLDADSGESSTRNQQTPHQEAVDLSNISPALYQALLLKITQDLQNQALSNQQSSTQPSLMQQPSIQQSSMQEPAMQQFSTQQHQIKHPTYHQAPVFLANFSTQSQWPMWDGMITSINSHVFQMKVKIEEQRGMLGSDRNVCLSIFNSIPSEKHPRILNWFETGGPDLKYNWVDFLEHLKAQFGDKQARQVAGNLFNRMRMGSCQYFSDFLTEFEIKLSQCGGTRRDDESKISLLETAINAPLRQLLLSKSMPTDDYQKWVSKVRVVAARLENTPSYRPSGSAGRKTWYLPQNGSASFFISKNSKDKAGPSLDSDGDTKVGGINAMKSLQTIISALNGVNKNLYQSKPRAKWRSLDEFKRLSQEGKCIRCQKKGHDTRLCPKYRAAKRPANLGHIKSHDDVSLQKYLSETNFDDDISDAEVSGEE